MNRRTTGQRLERREAKIQKKNKKKGERNSGRKWKVKDTSRSSLLFGRGTGV